MGVLGAYIRYAIYVPLLSILLLLITVAIETFFGLGVSSNATHVGVVIVSVMLACMAFGKKKKRYFTGLEKVAVIFGFWMITIFYLIVFTLLGPIDDANQVDTKALAAAILIYGVIDFFLIIAFVSITRKTLVNSGAIDC